MSEKLVSSSKIAEGVPPAQGRLPRDAVLPQVQGLLLVHGQHECDAITSKASLRSGKGADVPGFC